MTLNNNNQKAVQNLVAERVSNLQDDVWTIFSKVSNKYQTINLGQGFMSFPAPDFVKEALCTAVKKDLNQYAPIRGTPRLRNALAKSYSPILNRELNPETEIIATTGANEGIYSVLAAFINQGDEAIFIEPYFDQYLPNLKMNGGVPIYCPLRLEKNVDFNSKIPASSWKLDLKELESKITPKTKMIIVNTPYNPVGKVFTEQELLQIGDLAERHNLLILSDEVYDRLYYSPSKHVPIASLKNFWERTITVGSAGKTFGVTGWRLGWLIGPDHLIKYALAAHARICFCTSTPIQEAIADSFEQAETNNFFNKQIEEYDERREYLMKALDKLKLSYVIPEGSYFILINTDKISIPTESWEDAPEEIKARGNNYQMCYWLCKNIGITAIPCSEFYSEDNAPIAANLIRFAFCKSLDVLEQAVERLQKLKLYIKE
ncbi:PLP-dependent transferase [Neoconidiobolus thromboides FSU 785]|nr:PLP-dependent transferase [Neoconidiobolus thromboides FSU 785]